MPFDKAKESLEKINEAADHEYLLIQRITSDRFEAAQNLRFQYNDKPLISFTDFTSMVVMEECGIQRVMTEDKHFSHLQSDFRLVPK